MRQSPSTSARSTYARTSPRSTTSLALPSNAGAAAPRRFRSTKWRRGSTPSSPRPTTISAHALLAEGRVEDAIVQGRRAVAIRRDFAIGHLNLGRALAAGGRLAEAVTQYESALNLKHDLAEAHSNLGNVLARLGKPDNAISQYFQALKISPDRAEIHFNLAIVLARRGRTDEAIEQLHKPWPSSRSLPSRVPNSATC